MSAKSSKIIIAQNINYETSMGTTTRVYRCKDMITDEVFYLQMNTNAWEICNKLNEWRSKEYVTLSIRENIIVNIGSRHIHNNVMLYNYAKEVTGKRLDKLMGEYPEIFL